MALLSLPRYASRRHITMQNIITPNVCAVFSVSTRWAFGKHPKLNIDKKHRLILVTVVFSGQIRPKRRKVIQYLLAQKKETSITYSDYYQQIPVLACG